MSSPDPGRCRTAGWEMPKSMKFSGQKRQRGESNASSAGTDDIPVQNRYLDSNAITLPGQPMRYEVSAERTCLPCCAAFGS
eukprot:506442-Rhodomonas_salina.1